MSINAIDLLVEKHGKTVTIILNRPKARNALSPDLITNLNQQLLAIHKDYSIRQVILRGTGDHFCAGADIKFMQQSSNDTELQIQQDASAFANLLHTLNTLNKPTICITQGAVYGGAIGLVACCDIVIAMQDSIFCCSEVKLGLAPALISPYIINAIGSKAARRWLLTAETFNCVTAAQLGLVHQIVTKQQELDAAVDHFVTLINQAGPHAIAATKALLLEDLQCNNPATQTKTVQLNAKMRVAAEGQEGLAAFLEKRDPNW